MSFNPANFNLISLNGLTAAFNPNKDWILAIQDPNGEIITSISAENLGILLNGNIQLPDGVLNGLDLTINNASTPKTVSVSTGQWRINNGVYTLNAPYISNITAPSVSDRIDAILADDTGVVYYVFDFDGTIPDGNILVNTFTVLAAGGTITPSTTIPTQYAVMNGNNSGQFNVVTPGAFIDQLYSAISSFNHSARYAVRNNSGGNGATAGYQAINDLGRKLDLLITSSGHSLFGLLPDKAYLLTGGADLDIIAPSLTLNGSPISGGSSSTILPFDETDLLNETSGGVDYWYLPLTLVTLGTKRPYYIEVNDDQFSAVYNGTLGRLIGFDDPSVTTSQTINVYTI
jgi:hypothetical protein